MNLAQLRALVAVVDRGSFTIAGDALGITQSGVSHAVAALEAELGVLLLHRERGRALPTDVGARVVVHAREIVFREERIRCEGTAAADLASGRVKVGTFPSVTARFFSGFLADFGRRFPGIDVALFEGTDPEVLQWIDSRTVDVGLVTLPSSRIEAVPIARDPFLVALPSGHPLAGEEVLPIERLAAEPFILSKAGCEPLIRGLFESARLPLHPRAEALDMGTILAMVREGLGVTILPALSLPPAYPGVQAVLLSPPTERRLALGTRSLGSLPPAAAAFVHEARQWGERSGDTTAAIPDGSAPLVPGERPPPVESTPEATEAIGYRRSP